MLPSPRVAPPAMSPPHAGGERWLNDLLGRIERLANRCHTRHHTRVLPCVIQGEQALVHDRGLARRQPLIHAYLDHFCACNHVRLVEDRRGNELPVSRERRRNLASVIALAASLLAPAAAMAADAVSRDVVQHDPLADTGARADANVADVLRISAETRNRGTATQIDGGARPGQDSTLNSAVTRYDHDVPAFGGNQRYSYFEGDDLRALGQRDGNDVKLDVLVGGGPFSAPRLWGPFEQVAHDTVDVHLLVGADERDGFGLMKSSYSVRLDAAAQPATEREEAAVGECPSPYALHGPEESTPVLDVDGAGPDHPLHASVRGRAASGGLRAALKLRHRLRHRRR